MFVIVKISVSSRADGKLTTAACGLGEPRNVVEAAGLPRLVQDNGHDHGEVARRRDDRWLPDRAAAWPWLPDSDPGRGFEPQLVGGADIKCAVELVEVPHDLVAAELAG